MCSGVCCRLPKIGRERIHEEKSSLPRGGRRTVLIFGRPRRPRDQMLVRGAKLQPLTPSKRSAGIHRRAGQVQKFKGLFHKVQPAERGICAGTHWAGLAYRCARSSLNFVEFDGQGSRTRPWRGKRMDIFDLSFHFCFLSSYFCFSRYSTGGHTTVTHQKPLQDPQRDSAAVGGTHFATCHQGLCRLTFSSRPGMGRGGAAKVFWGGTAAKTQIVWILRQVGQGMEKKKHPKGFGVRVKDRSVQAF